MTDITAQAFREAADQCEGLDEEPMQRLLLAAAEQREQLDSLKAELIDARHRIMELELEKK